MTSADRTKIALTIVLMIPMPFLVPQGWERALILPLWVMAEVHLSGLGEERRSETGAAEMSKEVGTASGVFGITNMQGTRASKMSAELVRMAGVERENQITEEVERERGYGTDSRTRIGSGTGVGQSKRAKTEFLGEEKMATSADTGRRRAGAEVRHDSEIESETTIDDILETMRGGVTTEIVTTGGGGADMGT